ncbi:MAG: 50S ribosomal protein L11 methyltransferase [Chitinophagaceae bacterium]
MNYYKLTISIAESDERDILIASLAENGAEGFEELSDELIVFVPESEFNAGVFAELIGREWDQEMIEPKNWNAEWESNFEPVIVGDFCAVRAHFHPAFPQVAHEIVITPKMSFGTGHHATTRLMMEQMGDIDFKGKKVLDFGTGTGVLAILAEKLGAVDIMAIDNDSWSIENAQENCATNACGSVHVSDTDIEAIPAGTTFDVILANINRNILLQYMQIMQRLLIAGGTLLMSGLLTEDETVIRESAAAAGFSWEATLTRNNWICIRCARP